MIIKANKLLPITILFFILCIAIVCLPSTNSVVSANAAEEIAVFTNNNIVEYSTESYIDSSGNFTNFSSNQGQFSNALYESLDIKINNEIVSVNPNGITITNHKEIKVPSTYLLNFTIIYGDNVYNVNGVKVEVEEKKYEVVPTISKTEVVRYNALSYITDGVLNNFAKETEPFQNALFDALSFKIGDSEINESLEFSKILFYDTNYNKITYLIDPKTYTFNILFSYLGNSYLVKNVVFELKKSILDVSVELNGQLNLTIKEGEDYTPKIVYNGFLRNDNLTKLDFPATIPNEPKRPISNYEIRAEGAVSKYYEMNYISSYITITPNPIEEITYASAGEDLIILRGSYSPYAELEFIDVGVSLSSVTFTEINNTLERFYSSSGIFDKYKPIASYRINLKINEQKEELAGSKISIKMNESLKGHDEYYVVTLTNDGVYQVVSATQEHGYLSFYTTDLGDFVVLAPIKGINTTQFVIITFCVFGGVALCIIMVAVFRRKY